jgi:biopolymer transport protein ExbB
LIAALAPMLGFLGTVAGMIDAFAELGITAGGAGAPELAGPISRALITTYLGLIVGMVGLVAHMFFRNRLNLILSGVADVADQAVPLLQRLQREVAHAVSS